MRYAIISDIHSNLDALEAVVEDIDKRSIDAVLHLGDITGYGPQPNECIGLIQENNINGVAGNHDIAMFDGNMIEKFNQTAKDAAYINKRVLARESVDYLKSLPKSMTVEDFLLVHGKPPDSVEEYIAKPGLLNTTIINLAPKEMESMDTGLAFVGHTHLLGIYEYDGKKIRRKNFGTEPVNLSGNKYIINAGSVGQPRDGDPRARYVIFDDVERQVNTVYVGYDFEKTAEKIKKEGLPERCATRLATGD